MSGVPLGVMRQVLRRSKTNFCCFIIYKVKTLRRRSLCIWKVSGGCLEGVWMSMEVVLMMSQHNIGVWSVSGGCKEGQIIPGQFGALD